MILLKIDKIALPVDLCENSSPRYKRFGQVRSCPLVDLKTITQKQKSVCLNYNPSIYHVQNDR